MHELSVTQSVLAIATEHGERAGADKITAIHLVVGELTGFVDDSIQFYFDMLSPGTLAEGARLLIQRVPARVLCRACGKEFLLGNSRWICPNCSAVGGEVQDGRQFLVDSIVVE